MSEFNEVIFKEIPGKGGNVGHVLLNRPKALNALSFDMCIALDEKLKIWETQSDIKAVVIQGAGDRAFCAGGDIRRVYEAGPDNAEGAAEFFKREYSLNHRIFYFSKLTPSTALK